jgi:hypothetical protein
MKTKNLIENQISQINNTQNQKVMKTKKYSNSMKIVLIAGLMFLASGIAFSQTIEERKGGTSTYSVAASAATDEYTWTIEAAVAPTVVPVPSSGTGTPGDPFIIDWTANLTSIAVTWAADGAPDIASTAGVVTVQKRSTVGTLCPSTIQTLDISLWSLPSAIIDAVTSPDQDVCSTDAIGGSVTIDLTGAPDAVADGFDLVYDVAVSDPLLSVTGLVGLPGVDEVVNSNGATVTIPLPDALVNLHADPQYYTITLKTIQDDFDEIPVVVAAQVFTITVYPTPVTGPIGSTGTLNRR